MQSQNFWFEKNNFAPLAAIFSISLTKQKRIFRYIFHTLLYLIVYKQYTESKSQKHTTEKLRFYLYVSALLQLFLMNVYSFEEAWNNSIIFPKNYL